MICQYAMGMLKSNWQVCCLEHGDLCSYTMLKCLICSSTTAGTQSSTTRLRLPIVMQNTIFLFSVSHFLYVSFAADLSLDIPNHFTAKTPVPKNGDEVCHLSGEHELCFQCLLYGVSVEDTEASDGPQCLPLCQL